MNHTHHLCQCQCQCVCVCMYVCVCVPPLHLNNLDVFVRFRRTFTEVITFGGISVHDFCPIFINCQHVKSPIVFIQYKFIDVVTCRNTYFIIYIHRNMFVICYFFFLFFLLYLSIYNIIIIVIYIYILYI